VVERLTGTPLVDELNRRIIAPLNLTGTHMLSADAAGPLAPAWTTIFWASGAMTSSAADLARWGDALYGGEILLPETRQAMLELNDHDYGFGVQKVEVPGATGYGHTGLLNTYTKLLYHHPSEDLTIALLVNRSHVDLGGMLTVEAPEGGPSLLELATGR
jgi:D-alanyl-D-alanine carboxypeptidase